MPNCRTSNVVVVLCSCPYELFVVRLAIVKPVPRPPRPTFLRLARDVVKPSAPCGRVLAVSKSEQPVRPDFIAGIDEHRCCFASGQAGHLGEASGIPLVEALQDAAKLRRGKSLPIPLPGDRLAASIIHSLRELGESTNASHDRPCLNDGLPVFEKGN